MSQLSAKRSQINFKSFLWHAIFLALASNFMDIDTIIPAMLIQAGGNSLHLGILTAILLGGSSFFQLFFAGYLSDKTLKKNYLLTAINLRIFSLFSLSLLFFYSNSIRSDLVISFIFMHWVVSLRIYLIWIFLVNLLWQKNVRNFFPWKNLSQVSGFFFRH